ncbi:hypothetical protein AVEN_33924-1 [Araneus ventricosus]|uniref:Uncharacterized protein n=1 Tax=Araneus ventricosus TaxID=182803 RepID=A0A4Y2N132_ARAVE|nr:hypothetical protein AVEN_33924-1 [Araneus ventricosus]
MGNIFSRQSPTRSRLHSSWGVFAKKKKKITVSEPCESVFYQFPSRHRKSTSAPSDKTTTALRWKNQFNVGSHVFQSLLVAMATERGKGRKVGCLMDEEERIFKLVSSLSLRRLTLKLEGQPFFASICVLPISSRFLESRKVQGFRLLDPDLGDESMQGEICFLLLR